MQPSVRISGVRPARSMAGNASSGLQPVDVGHVRHYEPRLTDAPLQRRQRQSWSEIGVHDQQRTHAIGKISEPIGRQPGKAVDLQLDQSLGLFADGAHARSTRRSRAKFRRPAQLTRSTHARRAIAIILSKYDRMAVNLRGPYVGPSVAEILASHASGTGSPAKTAARVADAIAARGDDGTWLSTVPRDQLLATAEEIEKRPGARTLPLYGVPFAVKDSIDVEGVPTTLSCPDYAYTASTTAPVVRRLLDAGALYVGKTNLDQFATGLNGTRTPYTIPRSVYGGELISGGSSSGSALAVALGQVPFAVATDTAGSGRVPAALNGVIGFKSSRGLISTVGLVPA